MSTILELKELRAKLKEELQRLDGAIVGLGRSIDNLVEVVLTVENIVENQRKEH